MLSEYALTDFRIAESPVGHRSFNDRGADRVHANSLRGVFEGGGSSKTDDAMFAGDVHARSAGANQSSDGRHVHNRAPAALLEHLLNFICKAKPDAFETDVDDGVPIFFGLFNDGFPIAFDAGVVEGDVETAEFLDRFLHQRLHITGFRSVRFYEQAFASGSANQRDGFIAFRFAAAGDYNLGAFLGEENGGIAADAAGSAGDECNFSCERTCRLAGHTFSVQKPERELCKLGL